MFYAALQNNPSVHHPTSASWNKYLLFDLYQFIDIFEWMFDDDEKPAYYISASIFVYGGFLSSNIWLKVIMNYYKSNRESLLHQIYLIEYKNI